MSSPTSARLSWLLSVTEFVASANGLTEYQMGSFLQYYPNASVHSLMPFCTVSTSYVTSSLLSIGYPHSCVIHDRTSNAPSAMISSHLPISPLQSSTSWPLVTLVRLLL